MLAPDAFKAKAAEHQAKAKIWGQAHELCASLLDSLDLSPALVTEKVRGHVQAAIDAVHDAADRYDPKQTESSHVDA